MTVDGNSTQSPTIQDRRDSLASQRDALVGQRDELARRAAAGEDVSNDVLSLVDTSISAFGLVVSIVALGTASDGQARPPQLSLPDAVLRHHLGKIVDIASTALSSAGFASWALKEINDQWIRFEKAPDQKGGKTRMLYLARDAVIGLAYPAK